MSTAYEIPTFQDAYQHLCMVFGLESTSINDRKCRAAVIQALNDFTNRRKWNRYQKLLRINTNAQQTDGTIAFDFTGGANERMVTLTGSTWPAWTEGGELVIDNVFYPVDKKISSTVLTLPVAYNPGADVAAGTTYALRQDTYPLPDDFFQMGRLVHVSARRLLIQETAEEMLLRKRTIRTTGTPIAFCVTSAPDFTGGLAVQIAPLPTTASVLDGLYNSSPRPLRTVSYETGTVSVTAGGTTVTGSGTVFANAHAGAVIRFGDDSTNVPTSQVGYLCGYYPYSEQSIIRSVTSATSLELQQAALATHTTKKYSISDGIDMDQGTMLLLFLRLCEAHYAQLDSRQDALNRWRLAELAFNDAATADTKNIQPVSDYQVFSLATVANVVNLTP